MSLDPLSALLRLLALQRRDMERCGAELARRRSQRDRVQRNLTRLNDLCAHGSAGASTCSVLVANSAAYKQVLLQLMSQQQADLAQREAAVQQATAALQAAASRHEATRLLADEQRRRQLQAAVRREQKGQDEVVSQHFGAGSGMAQSPARW